MTHAFGSWQKFTENDPSRDLVTGTDPTGYLIPA